MFRYQVKYSWVLHKRRGYRTGDLLPEDFTERDRTRNIYSRRIGKVEIPDTVQESVPIKAESIPSVSKPTGTQTKTPVKTTQK